EVVIGPGVSSQGSPVGEAAGVAGAERLAATAADRGAPGFDNEYGHGVIDAYSAVAMADPLTSSYVPNAYPGYTRLTGQIVADFGNWTEDFKLELQLFVAGHYLGGATWVVQHAAAAATAAIAISDNSLLDWTRSGIATMTDLHPPGYELRNRVGITVRSLLAAAEGDTESAKSLLSELNYTFGPACGVSVDRIRGLFSAVLA
ncbi:hypothetical protein IIA29_11930, partial [candidate division KSB1 bacterium]|nr:hypothetical protein [candidate division KSB1 bacterium]